jgi:DNA-binding Xre family transcriptional regulator
VLECQPGDILEFEDSTNNNSINNKW